VTRRQLPQRAGLLGLNGGGAAAVVPPIEADIDIYDKECCLPCEGTAI